MKFEQTFLLITLRYAKKQGGKNTHGRELKNWMNNQCFAVSNNTFWNK